MHQDRAKSVNRPVAALSHKVLRILPQPVDGLVVHVEKITGNIVNGDGRGAGVVVDSFSSFGPDASIACSQA